MSFLQIEKEREEIREGGREGKGKEGGEKGRKRRRDNGVRVMEGRKDSDRG